MLEVFDETVQRAATLSLFPEEHEIPADALAISWQVALPQSLPLLPQPAYILQESASLSNAIPVNGEECPGCLSHPTGQPQRPYYKVSRGGQLVYLPLS